LPPVCVKMVVADRRADHLVHFVERLGRRKVDPLEQLNSLLERRGRDSILMRVPIAVGPHAASNDAHGVRQRGLAGEEPQFGPRVLAVLANLVVHDGAQCVRRRGGRGVRFIGGAGPASGSIGVPSGYYERRARRLGKSRPRAGAVAFVQRFDSALRVNLHYHVLWTDGVFAHELREGHRGVL